MVRRQNRLEENRSLSPAQRRGSHPLPAGRARTSRLDNARIYETLFQAIAHRKLPPGTKLSEERLCSVFGISRTRLREVFFRLAQDRLITLKPNQGAFVSSPSAQETSEVFAARRALEVAIVEHLCRQADATALARLECHLEREHAARLAQDRPRLTELTGEFHVLLAELTGNGLFLDILRRLVALTSLIITVYDDPKAQACKDEEHPRIVENIRNGHPAIACQVLLEHLDHVEHSLNMNTDENMGIDLEGILYELLEDPPVIRSDSPVSTLGSAP
jgi:DNA-binding GntR family transcriptional regulator